MKTLSKFACIVLCITSAIHLSANYKIDEMQSLMDMSLEDLLQVEIQIDSRTNTQLLSKSNAPIDIITSSQLRRTGYGELPKALNQLVPSFTYSNSTIDDLADHVRSFSLNGMRSDQVLVLINGKRLHHSSVFFASDSQMYGGTSVDLSLIPIEIIERIEILKDDASAQYGSDAIAGVINIVLKKKEVNEVVLLAGQRKAGDGDVYSANYNYGTPDFFFSMEVKKKDYSNTSGLDKRDYYFAGDPRNGNYKVTHRYGDPSNKNLTLTLNGEEALSDSETLYYVGKYTYKQSKSTGFFRRPLDDRNVRSIYPDGFLPEIVPIQHDLYASLGYLSKQEDYSLELSNTLGYNRMQIGVDNSLNASLGAASPTSFDAGTTQVFQNTINLDLTKTLDISWISPLNLAFGAEYRYERYKISEGDEASYINGQASVLDGPNIGNNTSAGSQLFPGFASSNATDIDRNVLAIYGEASLLLSENLEGKIALRDEEYSDFGNTFNAKVALAYKALQSLSVRSSISTGFRAPSLQQIGYYRTSTSFNNLGQATENGILPVSHKLSQLLGAEALEPEKSIRVNLGFSYRPTSKFHFKVDYFIVQVNDQIALSSRFKDTDPLPAAALAYMQANKIQGANFLMNALDTRTQGLELSVNYEMELSHNARLALNAQYHYNETKITNIDLPSGIILPLDQVFPRVEQERRISMLPKDKAILSSDYTKGDFNLLARANYFGKVLFVGDSADASKDQWFDAKVTVDLETSYRFNHYLTLSLGVHNLFNTYPEYKDSNPPFDGKGNIFQFSKISPFDYTGAFYYMRAVISF